MAELREKYVAPQIALERAEPLTFVSDTDNLAAFRLLVHAEIEEYLETKAKDGLSELEISFAAGNTAVRNNLGLFVIANALKGQLRVDANHWQEDARAVVRTARAWIAENNGIKEASFTMLSIFSGKMPDEVDPSLSASLSSYGSARGEVAHRSAKRVRTINAPSIEAKAAEDLVVGLESYFG